MSEKPHILIVDDEPHGVAVLVVRELIKAAQASVTVVDSPESASPILRRGGISAVVSDGLEGRWGKVRSQLGEEDIPFVLLTGSLDQIDKAEQVIRNGDTKLQVMNKGDLFSEDPAQKDRFIGMLRLG